ncbi:hypothetical protein [Nonomuraea sp. NPDC003201]
MENVLGRMTTPRAAGMGAALGAWFGLPSSLMVPLVAGPWAALLAGMAFGALLGAAFGVTACWAARIAEIQHVVRTGSVPGMKDLRGPALGLLPIV